MLQPSSQRPQEDLALSLVCSQLDSLKLGGLRGWGVGGVGVPGLTQVFALRDILAVIVQSRGAAVCAVIAFQAQSFSEAGHLSGGPQPPHLSQTPPSTTGYPSTPPPQPYDFISPSELGLTFPDLDSPRG